jgi:hypothetical protein
VGGVSDGDELEIGARRVVDLLVSEASSGLFADAGAEDGGIGVALVGLEALDAQDDDDDAEEPAAEDRAGAAAHRRAGGRAGEARRAR